MSVDKLKTILMCVLTAISNLLKVKGTLLNSVSLECLLMGTHMKLPAVLVIGNHMLQLVLTSFPFFISLMSLTATFQQMK